MSHVIVLREHQRGEPLGVLDRPLRLVYAHRDRDLYDFVDADGRVWTLTGQRLALELARPPASGD